MTVPLPRDRRPPSGKRAFAVAALFAIFASPSARAGGLWVYESASPSMGRAEAGVAAAALDASTAAGNPAGMTRIEGHQLTGGLLPIISSAKFDRDSSTTFPGGDGGDAGMFTPSLGLSYVYSVTDKLKIGTSSGSYLGAGLDYKNSWSGRYYTQEVGFITLGLNPVVAYKLTDWLSIGAGFSVVVAKLEDKTAIRNILEPGRGDGRLKFEDWDPGTGSALLSADLS